MATSKVISKAEPKKKLHLVSSTDQQREARLQRMRDSQNRRLSSETEEQREASQNYHSQRSISQRHIHRSSCLTRQQSERDAEVSSDIASVNYPRCSTCLEQFPGMKLHCDACLVLNVNAVVGMSMSQRMCMLKMIDIFLN